MPLADALTSTVQLRGYTRAITGAVKNRAALGDPVMLAILQSDRTLGNFVGILLRRITTLSLGGGKAADVAEGAAQAASTPITATPIAPPPTRREYARDILDSERSHLAGLGMGDLPPDILDAIVQEAVDTYGNTLISDILNLSTSASYAIGVTGTALSWSAMQNGYYDHINRGAGAPVGAMAGIRVKGVKDLAADAMSLGGAIQMSSQVQQFLNIGKNGFIGEFFGGLRLYMLDDVKTDGIDDVGMMWSPEGIATSHDIVPLPEESADVIVQAGRDLGWITVEAKRAVGTSAGTRIETAFRLGTAIGDPKGVTKIIYKTS